MNQGPVETNGRRNICESFMGTGRVKRDSEILAESCQLEIPRRSRRGEFAEKPQRPLKRAKDLMPRREIDAPMVVPCPQKFAIERSVVSDELRDMKRRTIRGQHRKGRVAAKKDCKTISSLARLDYFLGPTAPAKVILAQCVALGAAFIEKDFGLERFKRIQACIDGDGGDLSYRITTVRLYVE